MNQIKALNGGIWVTSRPFDPGVTCQVFDGQNDTPADLLTQRLSANYPIYFMLHV